MRELKQDEGPLLTFDKKRREAGNKNQDSFDDSQNKSTSRFGEFNIKNKSKVANKDKVKTYREVVHSKAPRSRKIINASDVVIKRQVRNQTVSPFAKRIKTESKKSDKPKRAQKESNKENIAVNVKNSSQA